MLCLLFIMSAEYSCTILQCGCHRVIKLTPAVSLCYGFTTAADCRRLEAVAV